MSCGLEVLGSSPSPASKFAKLLKDGELALLFLSCALFHMAPRRGIGKKRLYRCLAMMLELRAQGSEFCEWL